MEIGGAGRGDRRRSDSIEGEISAHLEARRRGGRRLLHLLPCFPFRLEGERKLCIVRRRREHLRQGWSWKVTGGCGRSSKVVDGHGRSLTAKEGQGRSREGHGRSMLRRRRSGKVVERSMRRRPRPSHLMSHLSRAHHGACTLAVGGAVGRGAVARCLERFARRGRLLGLGRRRKARVGLGETGRARLGRDSGGVVAGRQPGEHAVVRAQHAEEGAERVGEA